jgi:nitrate/TMAO reductase-like tetraheme cytochrome c subunit
VNDRIARIGNALRDRVTRLPPAALIALAAVVFAGLAVGGVLLYRTYDYVQHDNEFCMSCHLMRDPFDRFAQSAHRGLGCKACHQPTLAVRTQMALTQILEAPEEIHTHAEVPNRTCEECHVRGDPERWRQISAGAGHRVHLESQDPSLRGVTCVQCHSSSLHEFAATDKTCAQAGCHESVEVRLGRMGQLTIHCASCHDFNAPVATSAPADSLAVALRPQREECLSCHAMRSITRDFPEQDPHSGACGACHDPHEQTTPAQAVQSCAVGGCHARVEEATPFHRGLSPSVLTNCTSCHSAHVFAAPTECTQCHQDIYQHTPVQTTLVGRPRADAMQFNHAQHRNVDCTSCHSSEQRHGAVVITSFAQCRDCHHTPPVAQNCNTCHARNELRQPYRITQTLRFSVARQAQTRQLGFEHRQHETVACNSCHQAGPAQSAAAISCNSCHEQHHQPDVNCRACHETPRQGSHPVRAHVTCTGAGCHQPAPFQGAPQTRQVCLSCHTDLVNHMPNRNCVNCHVVPQARTGTAPAGAAAGRIHGVQERAQ